MPGSARLHGERIAGASGRPARIGLVSAWASRLGGGVFEAVVAHAELIRACGAEPVIFALHDKHSDEDRQLFGEAQVITCPTIGPEVPGWAPTMLRRMLDTDVDLMHLHGIWRYPSYAATKWAERTGRPYVISPHGMLDPWITSRGRLKKALARAGYERRSWRQATAFHALTQREADDIAAATGRTGGTMVVPNAVALTSHTIEEDDRPWVLYLGRIHPKKNLDALIAGWEAAGDTLKRARVRLLIAGWGEDGDLASFRERLARYEGDDIEFVGPAYGQRKADLIAGARFLALPSYSEGLPVAVLEAWAAGTPTLMSTQCNLPEGFDTGAALDCGTDSASVAAALTRGFSLSQEQWLVRSHAASMLVRTRFSPEIIRGRWRDLYREWLPAQYAR